MAGIPDRRKSDGVGFADKLALLATLFAGRERSRGGQVRRIVIIVFAYVTYSVVYNTSMRVLAYINKQGPEENGRPCSLTTCRVRFVLYSVYLLSNLYSAGFRCAISHVRIIALFFRVLGPNF